MFLDVIWLHIRGVGEWTNSLYNYFERTDKEAILSDDLAKDLEIMPSINSDEDHLSMAVNCSSIRPTTPSVMGDNMNMSLTPCLVPSFANSSLELTSCSPNETVIEMNKYAYKNALINTTYTKEADGDRKTDTAIEIDKKLSVASKDSVGSSFSSRSFSLYLPHRRTSFSSTSGSRAVQAKNKEDIKILLDASRNSLRVEDAYGGHAIARRKSKEKRRSVRVSIAKRGLRRCQTVIVMPVAYDEDDNDAKTNLKDSNLKTEEEMKDLKREEEIENVVLSQKPLKVRTYLEFVYNLISFVFFNGISVV